MLSSVASHPNFDLYPLSAEDSAQLASLVKKTAGHLVKNRQELVDGFFTRFFHRAIAEGALLKDGQPVKPPPEEIETMLAEFKKDVLNDLLTQVADELKESSQQHFAEAARLKESSEKKFAEAQKKFAQVREESKNVLTNQFWSIFNGKNPLPAEKIDDVFQTYLADCSLTVEKSLDGKKHFGRINSMNSVVRYLKDNPLTKTCDFRTFKTEVNDIPTLVEFLKIPSAFAIKGVALTSGISEIAKQKLAEAVAARASTQSPLKVQYFD